MESSNQIKSAVRDWMAERFSPTAIVFSSSGVRDILDKQSSLSPAELFRPFANVGDLNNISLQTCEKNQPFRLQNFRVNFVDSHKLDRQAQFDNSLLVDIIIQNSTPKKFQDISSSSIQKDTDVQLKRKLTSLLDYHKYEALTPWFFKWKRQFLQQTMFSDHELLTQPIAFIYFISATEANPMSALEILKRADNLPSLYKEGLYDDTPHAVQSFVFVLNPTDSSKAFQDCQDTIMQKHHLSTIFEISMTSKQQQQQPPLDDLWSRLVDLDEQGLMKELQVESLVRGRSFSDPDRLKISQVLKKVIEKQMLPFIEKRIRSLEGNVANTRKGIKNQFKSLWKKAERGESDGLKENFKMNKEELELRNLVDLAFVSQDYETAMRNGGIPLSDFKKCKAYRHAASCQEIIGLAQIAFEGSQNQTTSFKEIESMMETAYTLYSKAGKIQYLLRCGIYMYELYEKLERHNEASNVLIRLINEVKDNSIIVPLFQEQVGLKQLQMKNYRKFALYMIMAGKSYEKMNQKNYSFNCFTIVHPFYQRYGKGWNGIRFQLYSSLGRQSQSLGDISLAVQFFRNLLQLCCEFDNQNEQKNCLNEFLIAIQNWNGQKTMVLGLEGEEGQGSTEKTTQAHIGQLNLPVILEDSIDIYLSSEKLYTNRPETLINNLYFAHPTSVTTVDENQDYVIQQKAELNTNNCPWKYMAKHLFELMNDERRNNGVELPQEACQFNQEELNEFGVYDCTSRLRKRDLTVKKIRKAFIGESIVVKLLMRNPLMADIYLNNIRLVCRYDSAEPTSKDDYEQLDRNIILRSLETKEIILEIFPKRAGKFIIERIEWVLFDVVSCAYQMVKPIDKDKKLLTQEELQVSKKLLDRENNFIYDVLERSGEVNAKIVLPEQQEQNNTFIFTEVHKAQLQLVNESYKYELKNGYAVCSHPMIFGFSRMRLFDKIEQGGKFTLPLNMRASLMHKNEIKFLIRYEVCNQQEGAEAAQTDKMSRFRFCRLVFNLESLYAFTPKRHVHLSTKQANEHIFNIQIVDNVQPGTSIYQTPQIQAIEIINRKRLWSLRRKDDKGQFFVIIPTANQAEDQKEQSIIVYQENPLEGVVSIFDSPEKTNYFTQEQAFVMSKFKMQPTNEEEEVDIVIQWAMPGLKKRGFYCLFKIPLLKMHKQLTEQQKKFQRNAHKGKEMGGGIVRDIARINPLHIAYSYTKSVSHDFSTNKAAIVTFSLTLSNMIQTQDFTLNCKVEGINEWTQLNNPTDVSESNGFLWVGKTKFIIRHLKPNVIRFLSFIGMFQEIKKVELRCAILKPGVYNLNRLCVTILDPSEIGEEMTKMKNHHFVREIRLPDDILLTAIDTSKPDIFDSMTPTDGEQNLISFD